MKHANLFTIIIPSLNEENYIGFLLEDLVKQEEKDFAVIVVDGNSQDKTAEIVDRFKEKLHITFYSIRRQNVSFQRNKGANKAKGSYLVFLDADTRIGPTFLKKIHLAITKKGGLIFLPAIFPDERTSQNVFIFRLVNSLIETSQFSRKPLSSGGSFIIEKTLFGLLGGFNENLYLGEDHNLIQRSQKWGVKAKMLREAKVIVCLRRARREGQIRFLYKNLLAAVHIFIKGEIKEDIFPYSMGGNEYSLKRKNSFYEIKGKMTMKQFFQRVSSMIN